MISERTFAGGFSTFWAELLPLLTPKFVQLVNEGYEQRLLDDCGRDIEPISLQPNPVLASFLGEFAFFLAGEAAASGKAVVDVFETDALRGNARQLAMDRIARFEAVGATELDEISQSRSLGLAAFNLARNYEYFFRQRQGTGVIEFSPNVKGAGFLPTCCGDISWGTALFEVKTVNRNLSSKDIRQLVVYLALQANTGERRWTVGGFLNPRRAVYYEFGVDDLIWRMSGSRPAIDVFHDVIRFVDDRGIQIDAVF